MERDGLFNQHRWLVWKETSCWYHMMTKWKRFPHHCFLWGERRILLTKGQKYWTWVFSLSLTWTSCWTQSEDIIVLCFKVSISSDESGGMSKLVRAGTGTIVWLPRRQWNVRECYKWNRSLLKHNKMQTIFSDAFSWMKRFVLWNKNFTEICS